MAKPILPPVERCVRSARRRLFGQIVLNQLGLATGIALIAAASWLLAFPYVWESGPVSARWGICGGLIALGLVVGLFRAIRQRPSREAAAMTLDQRFELRERITTVLSLDPVLQKTSAGQAVMADAEEHAAKLQIASKFRVGPGRRALFLPLQIAAVIAIAFFYDPAVNSGTAGGKTDDEQAKINEDEAKMKQPNARPFIKPPAERANKSEELKALETELNKLYAEANKETPTEKEKPELLREKVERIANAEDQLRKREEQAAEKFQKLQEQMNKLTALDQGEERQEGPGKDFEEALSKGDLQKAIDEADKLKKKLKDKKLDEKQQQQLKDELKNFEQKMDKLTREQEQKKKELKDLIAKAKQEGRDAETLERELKNLMDNMEVPKELQELATAMKKCKSALDKNNLEEAAEQLGEVSKQLGEMDRELQDLEDIEEHLQNLKQMKKEACKNCDGEGKCKGKEGEKDDADGYAEGASGRRKENKDALTKKGDDERVRGGFDPRGRKTYGGATTGQAFKKKSSVEMAGEIQQAVQDAPEAMEVQRLPKAAKEMVKEYFEKLGGQTPKKPQDK
jgi:uncharacterized coiled-coil DUF342 family protein